MISSFDTLAVSIPTKKSTYVMVQKIVLTDVIPLYGFSWSLSVYPLQTKWMLAMSTFKSWAMPFLRFLKLSKQYIPRLTSPKSGTLGRSSWSYTKRENSNSVIEYMSSELNPIQSSIQMYTISESVLKSVKILFYRTYNSVLIKLINQVTKPRYNFSYIIIVDIFCFGSDDKAREIHPDCINK